LALASLTGFFISTMVFLLELKLVQIVQAVQKVQSILNLVTLSVRHR